MILVTLIAISVMNALILNMFFSPSLHFNETSVNISNGFKVALLEASPGDR